jgi:hypothetical protein
MAIIWVGAFALVNAAFYFLSGNYFDSHREIVNGASRLTYSPEQMTHVRMTFAVFAGVVAACGFTAGIRPRAVGHLLAVLLGACHLVAGVAAFLQDLRVVGTTLLVSGVLMPVLAWHSHRRSRPAWAFLIAICGVFAVVEFFGVSKIRDALGVGLWTALILPGVSAVATAALVAVRGEYD